MNKNFLASLLGPFSMQTPPVREGFYAIAIKGTSQFEMWFWDGTSWLDSDDGLGENRPAELASGWYGKFQPGTEASDGLDDGLG